MAPAKAEKFKGSIHLLQQYRSDGNQSDYDTGQQSSLGPVISWGAQTNEKDWNKALNITASRMGCSGAPSGCVTGADRSAKTADLNAVYIAYMMLPDTAIDYAAQYSQLSITHPVMVELGVDDFISQYIKLNVPDKNDFVRRVISAVKSRNPKLGFGITLYLDDLTSASCRNLPDDIRSRIDYIHLYPKYRIDGKNYAAYVQLARSLFPKARIIAGVYAMDRIDYASCQKGTSTPCSQRQEMSLFARTFKNQLKLWRTGQIFGLEFISGHFGSEDQISSFDDPRECQPARRNLCISNTKQMREFVRKTLRD